MKQKIENNSPPINEMVDKIFENNNHFGFDETQTRFKLLKNIQINKKNLLKHKYNKKYNEWERNGENEIVLVFDLPCSSLEMKDLKNENEKMKKEVVELRKENQMVKNEVSGLKNENQVVKNENEKMKKEVVELRKENQMVKNEVSGLKNENQMVKNEVIGLKNENQKMKNENRVVKSEVVELEKRIKEQIKTIQSFSSVPEKEVNIIIFFIFNFLFQVINKLILLIISLINLLFLKLYLIKNK